MQPLSGSHRLDLLTALMKMSLVLRLPRKMHLCRSSSHAPRLPLFLEMLQNPRVLLTFEKVHNPLRLPRESTPEPPKVERTCGVLYILTSKCASRHNGVHFSTSQLPKVARTCGALYILTSLFRHLNFQKWSEPGVFFTCWLRNYVFAPQRRALFRHLNFQKWSGAGVFCTF